MRTQCALSSVSKLVEMPSWGLFTQEGDVDAKGKPLSLTMDLDPVSFICFSRGSVVKNPPDKAGDAENAGSIPGLGGSPGEGKGNPLQYSCLGNPMDREAWQATVHGVAKELDKT